MAMWRQLLLALTLAVASCSVVGASRHSNLAGLDTVEIEARHARHGVHHHVNQRSLKGDDDDDDDDLSLIHI